jgi:DNA-binding XRE family transcriptional regulator
VSYTGKNEKIIPKRLIGRVFGKSVEDIFVLRDIELLIY